MTDIPLGGVQKIGIECFKPTVFEHSEKLSEPHLMRVLKEQLRAPPINLGELS